MPSATSSLRPPRGASDISFVALVLGAVVALAGCIDRRIAEAPIAATGESTGAFTLGVNNKLDLLFVVDDSDSMRREQQQLAGHFRAMIEVLEALPGGRPDLHIGVVSTDIGTDAGCKRADVPGGVLRNEPNPGRDPALAGCLGPRGRFLEDTVDPKTGERRQNYDGELADSFACIATLGTGGCRFEAPLEAMRRALSPDTVENAGFLRDDSLLAVVFISDEDDCSATDARLFSNGTRVDGIDIGPVSSFRCFDFGATCEDGPTRQAGARRGCTAREDSPFLVPVGHYEDALRDLRPDGERLVVAGIVGAPAVSVGVDDKGNVELEPSCRLPGGGGADTETAYPPLRTDNFLARFEHRAREPICADDLRPAIRAIGRQIAESIYGRCLPSPTLDLRPDEPGLQAECTVTEVQSPRAPKPRGTPVPACAPGVDPAAPPAPCWTVAPNPDICERAPAMLEVQLHYPTGVSRDPDTRIEIHCRSR